MTSASQSAQGTTLTRAGSLIAELKNIDGIKIKRNTWDATSHDSPAGYDEFKPGRKSGGEVALEGMFIAGDTNGQIGLLADLNAGTLQHFIMTFPSAIGATWTFDGIVTAFETGASSEDKPATFKASIKVSGQPVLGIGASAGFTTPFLSTSTGTLFPVAASTTYEYYLPVVTGTTSITVTPTATAGVITVTANGATQTVTSGAASSAIALGAAGTTTLVTITVTETGKSPKVYHVLVGRA